MTGPLEIAFDMIESVYLEGTGSIIVGLYEGTLASKSSDQFVSSLT